MPPLTGASAIFSACPAAALPVAFVAGCAGCLAAVFSAFAPLETAAAFRANVSVVVAAFEFLEDLAGVAVLATITALADCMFFLDFCTAFVLDGGAVFLAVIVHL